MPGPIAAWLSNATDGVEMCTRRPQSAGGLDHVGGALDVDLGEAAPGGPGRHEGGEVDDGVVALGRPAHPGVVGDVTEDIGEADAAAVGAGSR